MTANPFGVVDHRPFSALGLKLAYGRRADGSLAHISRVERGESCGCVCPACERPLIARKGERKADHFAHKGDAACGYGAETNAHLWAKEVLEVERRIYLPMIEVELEGRVDTDWKGGFFAFDEVRLESSLGSFVPDVVLTAKDRELIVEVRVTHACDEAKIAKIRDRGVSAIEVDLSSYRTSQNRAEVTRALLQGAPRTWLHNPRFDLVERRLSDRIAKEKAEVQARAARAARRILDALPKSPAGPSPLHKEARKQVADLGLVKFIHLEVPSSPGFIVTPTAWQAAVLSRAVFPEAKTPAWQRGPIEPEILLDDLKDCLAPAFHRPLDKILSAAILETSPGFVLPSAAIQAYLEALTDKGLLTRRKSAHVLSEPAAQHIAQKLEHARLADRRNTELRGRVHALLHGLSEEEREGFSYDRWLEAISCEHGGPQAFLTSGTPFWWAFEERLNEVERMARFWSVATDHFGLPLAGLASRVARSLEEKERAAAERAAARQAAEAEARVEAAAERAREVFGTNAPVWMAAIDIKVGSSPAETARRDAAGLTRVYRALDRIERRRTEEARCKQAALDAQEELRQATLRIYSPERAQVFLKSGHPGLGGQSPLQYCQEAVSLRTCLKLLPRRPDSRR